MHTLLPLMGWSGRAPAPLAREAGKGRLSQGACMSQKLSSAIDVIAHRYRQGRKVQVRILRKKCTVGQSAKSIRIFYTPKCGRASSARRDGTWNHESPIGPPHPPADVQ